MKKQTTLALLALVVIGGVYVGSNLTPSIVSVNDSLTNTILSVAPRSQAANTEGFGSGLIGWWKLDEASGITTMDSSGNGNTATLYNGQAWVPGKFGSSLVFGNSRYVQTANTVPIGNTGTVSLWFKYADNINNQLIVGNSNWSTDRNGFAIAKGSSLGTFYFELSNATTRQYIITTASTAGNGNWHLLTAVWEGVGANMRFYVDGVQTGSAVQTLTPVSTLHKLTMGKDPANSAYYLSDGTIDDVRVYNRALSQAEVASLFGASGPGATAAALSGYAWSSNIGWVKLDDTVSITSATSGGGYLLEGYAWASNIGWIKFGGLTDFPAGGIAAGVAATNATVSSLGVVTGWARACAGTLQGDCSTSNSRADGWDGWIALSGTNFPSVAGGAASSGVFLDTTAKTLKGKAWGGTNVGWLDFNATAALINLTASCIGSLNAVTRDVTYSTIASGGSGSGYKYNWNGAGFGIAYGNSSSTVVVYNAANTNPVTMTLQVQDAANPSATVSPACPAISTTPTVVNITGGACSINGNVYPPDVLTKLQIGIDTASFSANTASLVGGTPPYTFTWYTGPSIPAVNTNSVSSYKTPAYTSTFNPYMTSVRITDGAGGTTAGQGDILCGRVQVTDTASAMLSLKVGNTSDTANIDSYSVKDGLNQNHSPQMIIKQGKPFGLKWDNSYTLPNYVCLGKASLEIGVNPFTGNEYGVKSKQYDSAFTKTIPTGDYKFSIQCVDQNNASVVANQEVKVKIINVTGGER